MGTNLTETEHMGGGRVRLHAGHSIGRDCGVSLGVCQIGAIRVSKTHLLTECQRVALTSALCSHWEQHYWLHPSSDVKALDIPKLDCIIVSFRHDSIITVIPRVFSVFSPAPSVVNVKMYFGIETLMTTACPCFPSWILKYIFSHSLESELWCHT